MKTSKNIFRKVSAYLILLNVLAVHGAHATLPCANSLGGTYEFGTVPKFCNISPLQTHSFVLDQYGPLVFDDKKASSAARGQYMSALYPVIRETAAYYIRRRNPKVSSAEVEGFTLAVYALAAQESYWSHYRKGSDGVIRAMRGDHLHGYGLMQIDDRSHGAMISTGHATDLIFNMLTGLDIFYSQWVRSATVSCVPSASDYRDRARAAWAAYNGGGGSICRWKNTKSKWARNDKEFFAKITDRPYLPFVSNTAAPPPIDVRCMAEGRRPCALVKN